MPRCPAAPAGAISLNPLNHPLSLLVVAEGHKHLVQHNLVKDFVPSRAQAIREPKGLPTTFRYKLPHSAAPQTTQGGPDLHATRPPRGFRTVLHRFPRGARVQIC